MGRVPGEPCTVVCLEAGGPGLGAPASPLTAYGQPLGRGHDLNGAALFSQGQLAERESVGGKQDVGRLGVEFCRGARVTHHSIRSRAHSDVCLGSLGRGVCCLVNYKRMGQTGRCVGGMILGEALNGAGKVMEPPLRLCAWHGPARGSSLRVLGGVPR